MAAVRIGISGWRYAPWRGRFYPKGLGQKDELVYAARQFSSIEINGTFYSLQRPQSFAAWHDATPKDFMFAVKGPRYITHMLRLKNARVPLANFFASGVLRLGPKLGPVLWQLPPNFGFDPVRLGQFFGLLPRTAQAAARLAKSHDKKLKARAWLKAGSDHPIRNALEIRHDSFCDGGFIRLLRQHDIGLVVADTVEWPLLMDATADFVYVRLHGSEQLYASGYGDKALEVWARRIRAWMVGQEAKGKHAGPKAPMRKRDVYAYFDNDAKVRAPFDALSLQRRLGLTGPSRVLVRLVMEGADDAGRHQLAPASTARLVAVRALGTPPRKVIIPLSSTTPSRIATGPAYGEAVSVRNERP
jgi:uncharacterized protein YecE (DUF72 family)